MPVVPHGVSLSLGGTDPLEPQRVARLAQLAERFGSPLVSEHVAFCRAGGMEAGHLLPVPRTREALAVLTANIRAAQAELPVPLAVENIAALVSWPEDEFTEADFLTELVERTGVLLLLDVANLYTAQVNFGLDPAATLDRLPLSEVAYVHVAGGILRDGIWHDTHAHPVTDEILDILAALAERSPRQAYCLNATTPIPPTPSWPPNCPRSGRCSRMPASADPPGLADPGADPGASASAGSLAARQLALVSALVAGAAPPAGMAEDRVHIQAQALLRKRARSVARHQPDVAASLGDGFWPAFQRYAAADPTPPANTSSDAQRFARHVRKSYRSRRLIRLVSAWDRRGRRQVRACQLEVIVATATQQLTALWRDCARRWTERYSRDLYARPADPRCRLGAADSRAGRR